MTDIERNKFFEDKKHETIDSILGKDISYPVTEDKSTIAIDVNWNRGKIWNNDVRILNGMNYYDMVGLARYQLSLRNNGGIVYSVVKTSLAEEAPVIK